MNVPSTWAEIVRLRAGDDGLGLLFEDDSWTWAQIVQAGADRMAVAAELVPAPEGRPLHIGILLDNVPDFVFWIAGAAMSGAAVVGINSSRAAAELALDIEHADVDLIVTEPRLLALVADGGHGVPPERVLDIESRRYRGLLAAHAGSPLPDATPAPEDHAFLMYSSGSTGRPKAVIAGQGRMGRLMGAIVDRIELTRESRTYLCMPLFHGNAVIMNLMPAFTIGASIGMVRKFSASRFSDDIHRFGATYLNYVGRALSYVLSQAEDPRDRTSTLRLAYGTEASEMDIARFTERFGCRVSEGYGSSEGVFRINRTNDTPPGALGSVPGGLDVRVLDQGTGRECPRARFDEHGRLVDEAAVGEIVGVGLAHAFEGYYKNPAAEAERIRGDDFWSGDLAYRDEEGWFYFAGRSSDWLRVDSENFSAAQVEQILRRAPGIAVAPVFAVPDPVTGDRVMCVLELERGASFDAVGFGRFLGAQEDLGAKWWPSFVRVTERVPLTGSNKLDKAPLRRAAWATDDPIWVRRGRTEVYEPLDATAREALIAQFVEHGRSTHLPALLGVTP
ncbi:MAG: AMP-binding protein [Nocardioides sp.]|uniref:AMP-binding protein n=1 Tax=Nocardioides sp. TaxID=35761 RepID=UPI0039E25EDD